LTDGRQANQAFSIVFVVIGQQPRSESLRLLEARRNSLASLLEYGMTTQRSTELAKMFRHERLFCPKQARLECPFGLMDVLPEPGRMLRPLYVYVSWPVVVSKGNRQSFAPIGISHESTLHKAQRICARHHVHSGAKTMLVLATMPGRDEQRRRRVTRPQQCTVPEHTIQANVHKISSRADQQTSGSI